jgi:pSer/pThr/pTyr-binding forkhead associated (FHA) protein
VIRKLIIGNGRSEREILLVGNITIGRDPACHVSEPDPLLSRRHAEIIANVHGVSVRDLNSRNGILVNGEKTREQVLLPGDVVQLGHLQLRYVEENPRTADGMASRGMDARRQPPAPPAQAPYDIDRYRPDQPTRPSSQPTPQPSRWRPEPTPLPGRRTSAPPPQAPRPHQEGVPRGRAAFDETVAIPVQGRGQEGFDQTMAAPRPTGPSHHDTTLGHAPADLDATMLAPISSRDLPGGNRWTDPDATMLATTVTGLSPDSLMAPGNATFASALEHLSGIANPGNEQLRPGPGARLVANAELTVTDATPGCAELLGVPDDQLIGDSLTDVFLRGVRRAYAEPGTALSLTVARGPRGSITVTFTLEKTGGTE